MRNMKGKFRKVRHRRGVSQNEQRGLMAYGPGGNKQAERRQGSPHNARGGACLEHGGQRCARQPAAALLALFAAAAAPRALGARRRGGGGLFRSQAAQQRLERGEHVGGRGGEGGLALAPRVKDHLCRQAGAGQREAGKSEGRGGGE